MAKDFYQLLKEVHYCLFNFCFFPFLLQIMEVLSVQRPSQTVWRQLKSTMDTWVWITEAQTLAICVNIIIELEIKEREREKRNAMVLVSLILPITKN